MAHKNVGLRVYAGGRHLTGKREGVTPRRVGVDARGDTGSLDKGKVRLDLAGGGAHAGLLAAFEVHQAKVIGLHKALADERGRAKHEVLGHADTNVTAVAVDIVSVPEATAYVADSLLEHGEQVGTEEVFNFNRGDGIVDGPVEHKVRQIRFNTPGFRHQSERC